LLYAFIAAEFAFAPIPARAPPVATQGILAWLRRNLFDGVGNSIATVVTLLVLAWLLPPLINWGVVNAVFAPDNAACRAAHETGACWGVIAEKGRLILFGRYPYAEQWRPLLACAVLIGLLVASCLRVFWRPWLAWLWIAVLALFLMLMRGGVLGLVPAETRSPGSACSA
jgi:general L-amino acid transport system permease protein